MRWLLLLPLAACTPHVETCLTFPVGCSQSGGGGLPLLSGGNVPPRPDPGPAPAPEPQPPAPDPEPPKPPKPEPKPHHHDDDLEDHDDKRDGDRKHYRKRGHDDD